MSSTASRSSYADAFAFLLLCTLLPRGYSRGGIPGADLFLSAPTLVIVVDSEEFRKISFRRRRVAYPKQHSLA